MAATGTTGEPTRAEIDGMAGPVVLEFGASWCPHCHAVQPALTENLRRHPEVRHIKIEDGRGKPLGRSFRVKLWPTLVFLRDGEVVARAVRPPPEEVEAGFEAVVGQASA